MEHDEATPTVAVVMTAGTRSVFISSDTANDAPSRLFQMEQLRIPAPVQSRRAFGQEINGFASEVRPGLAQVALALARIMDNPKAVNQQPAAAKTLAGLLDKLRTESAPGRRGHLASVKSMTARPSSAEGPKALRATTVQLDDCAKRSAAPGGGDSIC